VDITSDLMIMSIPLALLRTLQLDRKKKIGLAVVFSLGCIIIAFAIIRMTQVIHHKVVDLVGLAIWSSVESAVSVVVGCLPPLKGFFAKGIRSYTTKKSANRYGGGPSGDHAGHAGHGTYAGGSKSKSAVVTESIALDETDHSRFEQVDGQIYVSKSYGWHHETRSEADAHSNGEYDDTAGIVHRMGDIESGDSSRERIVGHAR
jgi:hypothetical protein